jgi:hypothetical protein
MLPLLSSTIVKQMTRLSAEMDVYATDSCGAFERIVLVSPDWLSVKSGLSPAAISSRRLSAPGHGGVENRDPARSTVEGGDTPAVRRAGA